MKLNQSSLLSIFNPITISYRCYKPTFHFGKRYFFVMVTCLMQNIFLQFLVKTRMFTIFKDFSDISPKSILTFISLATVKNDVN